MPSWSAPLPHWATPRGTTTTPGATVPQPPTRTGPRLPWRSTPTERASKFISHTPFQRFGVPEELTGTLIYLLSNASRFVNGETVLVDGGFNAYSGV